MEINYLLEQFATLNRILLAISILIPWIWISYDGWKTSGEEFESRYLMDWVLGAIPVIIPILAVTDGAAWYSVVFVGLVWGFFTKGGSERLRKLIPRTGVDPKKELMRNARKTMKKLGINAAESALDRAVGGLLKKVN